MAKFEIKFDTKKLEKELNKQVNEIVRKKQKEILIQQNKERLSMDILSQNSETMLEVFINKYNENKDYTINGNISEFLREKINKDEKDIIRGIIEVLKSNGLINVSWASNTVSNVALTQAGRTYFEREKKYNEKFERLSSKNIYNNINATGSTVFMGDVIGSTINIF